VNISQNWEKTDLSSPQADILIQYSRMNPEEKELLNRSLRLSEENNKILRKMQRTARWALIWGLVKVIIVIVPLVLGVIYLQPFFDSASEVINQGVQLINSSGN